MKIAGKLPAVLVASLLILAGCDDTAGRSAAPASASAAMPTTAPPGATSAGPSASAGHSASAEVVARDGRSAAYLLSLDGTGRTLTFDGVEFLTGKAGAAAFAQAHPSPGGGEDDIYSGFFVIDDDPSPQTLPLSPHVQILVIRKGGQVADKPLALADAPAWFATYRPMAGQPDRLWYEPFWLTVQNGQIVQLTEQYAPLGTGS